MDIPATLDTAWRDHDRAPRAVFDTVAALVPTAGAEHAGGVAALLTHVATEHLHAPAEAVAPLRTLAERTGAGAAHRYLAALLWADDPPAAEAALTAGTDPAHPPRSSRIRVLSLAASGLAARRETAAAAAVLTEAADLADAGLGAGDPAARSLAVTANNLACDLEERGERTPAETALMKRAAHLARRWWEVAGDWTNVKIAEVRLAHTHLQAGEPDTAATHAGNALALCDANGASDGDRFFPWLALARAEAARGAREAAGRALDRARAALEATDPADRSWYAEELERAVADLG